jgi:hypothetical protein
MVALLVSPTYAAHKDDFVINIKVGDEYVKEIDGIAHVKFNSEYTVFLKNNHDRRCSARVYIDGARVSQKGDFVIDAGGFLDLERFVIDLNEGKRFKFVPVDHPDVDDPTRSENGIVRVEFRLEQEVPQMYFYDDYDNEFYFPNEYSEYNILVSNTDAGATIGGSTSEQVFHSVNYKFEDEFTEIKLQMKGM